MAVNLPEIYIAYEKSGQDETGVRFILALIISWLVYRCHMTIRPGQRATIIR